MRSKFSLPPRQGLYDPSLERENCGVGFVAHIKGHASHQYVLDAATMLIAMDHRGACGCESNTGDGSGMLTTLPHKFLRKVARKDLGLELPDLGRYAAGLVFLPKDPVERQHCKQTVEEIVKRQAQRILGWRQLPTDSAGADIGPTALEAEPAIEQLFVGAAEGLEVDAFERQLYIIRKAASHSIRGNEALEHALQFYICSLSTKVIIYKGMLTSQQLLPYFPDLMDADFETHLAMVHSRFSTNTFPSWDRAQPLRFMSHNGEINTLRGNTNWMAARRTRASSPLYGQEISKLFPVVEPHCSDSGSFDNVLEFLLMTGRTLQEAILMMVPEAWQKHQSMSQEKRAFYEYLSCMMEPWDGPASIAFTDGRFIGAVLDRNGLRPSRYYITHDDRVIMASEVGVLPVPSELVREKGRLQPGKIFLIDFEQGRLIPDEELKHDFAASRPYGQWLGEQRITLKDLPGAQPMEYDFPTLFPRMLSFGYTSETMHFMLVPMIEESRDPVGSMGNDAALAFLSNQPRMIFDYFKQLFAQVTNPAIDSIREEVVMSLECYIGPERNLLDMTPEHAHRLLIEHPILTNSELAKIVSMDHRGWKTKKVDITFPKLEGKPGLTAAIGRICGDVEQAINDGYSIVVLSDRDVGPDRVAVSSLLATGAVHHHLIKKALRTQVGLILETGEAREVHHHCLLIGYGADAINPYLAFEALWYATLDGQLPKEKFNDIDVIMASYRKAVAKGMLKVLAKMGISTLQSYKGAQIFEALGLKDEIIDLCFIGTKSRIQAVGFDVLAEEAMRRHGLGYPADSARQLHTLPNPGDFHWRSAGERHGWDPVAIANLQLAARTDDKSAYWRFAQHINHDNEMKCTLRGLLDFRYGLFGPEVPLDEVEPAKEIVKRFCTGAMSFGSISAEAHESLAIAMNQIGGKSNTGEGGEDPARFLPLPDGRSRRSAIKQVASGRFGVTIDYLTNADELQIKISQGAKPGEGGELPGGKVDQNIARIRYSTPGVGLISPPPHHDIYSIEDLAQLIYDLKNANPSARISVKLVSEVGVGVVAAGVSKAHAEHIVIAGDVGGTGASPLTSIKHAGLPWELGLAEAHQTLVLNNLRSRVVLQTDGGLKTGRDIVIAALLGAEEFGFATAPLITLGCIMMRKCHLNTCPVGVATQDPELRKKFSGKPEHVINYLFMVAEEARQIMAKLGFRKIDEMIGRVDVLEPSKAIEHWKVDGLDLTTMLTLATSLRSDAETRQTIGQDHGLEKSLDCTVLVPRSREALEQKRAVRIEHEVTNVHRTVGTILSHEIAKRFGQAGLPDDTIHIKLTGSAGQSLGAFLAHGVTIEVEGDANDYVGKGLSGGHVIVYPPENSTFQSEDQILIGNVCLYGATSGEAYFNGRAAERFCVRNSGARAVVEGVGDHGCEYMTGGRVVILGPTGRNFAAGMSGGIAYVWDRTGDFPALCNNEMVLLERIETDLEEAEIREMITRHAEATGSQIARRVLADWSTFLAQCVKVMPIDYKRVLEQRSSESTKGQESVVRATRRPVINSSTH